MLGSVRAWPQGQLDAALCLAESGRRTSFRLVTATRGKHRAA